jgi:hypothetical protein
MGLKYEKANNKGKWGNLSIYKQWYKHRKLIYKIISIIIIGIRKQKRICKSY